MILNRLTSLGDEGRVFGGDGKDYANTQRDVVQQWTPLNNAELIGLSGSGRKTAKNVYGRKRVVTQTYSQEPDEWAIEGTSWHWLPVTPDTGYGFNDDDEEQ